MSRATIRRTLVALAVLAVGAALMVAPDAGAAGAAAGRAGTNLAYDDPFSSSRTSWWRSARFGMFIHFGAYSQLEGEYRRADGTTCRSAEWIKRNCDIPTSEYENIAAKFNPASFNATAIVALAKAAGQKY